MNPLAILPLPYRLLAYLALGVALFGFGFLKGCEHGEKELNAERGKAATETIRLAKARTVVTEKIVIKYLPAITKIETITETIVKETPVYVPLSDPPVSGGFRVLHDAAALGQLPDPARLPDAAPAAAQDVARTVAENYGTCRADQERLRGLQEWVREQQKVK